MLFFEKKLYDIYLVLYEEYNKKYKIVQKFIFQKILKFYEFL